MTSPNTYNVDSSPKVRNVGSAYTTFLYAGQPIAYLESIADSGQKPVASYETIHPLGEKHPVEIVTSRALDSGTITVTIRELWGQEIWEQLAGLTGAKTIVDIFNQLAAAKTAVTCAKVIFDPNGNKYTKTYHNCVIVGIEDGEQVMISSLSIAKTIEIAYTHTTYDSAPYAFPV
jgi:hypothetical protein